MIDFEMKKTHKEDQYNHDAEDLYDSMGIDKQRLGEIVKESTLNVFAVKNNKSEIFEAIENDDSLSTREKMMIMYLFAKGPEIVIPIIAKYSK